MTRTVIGAIVATFVTGGLGLTTAYQVHKHQSAAATPSAAPLTVGASSVEIEKSPSVERVKAGPITAEQRPDEQSVTIGKSLSAKQTKSSQSVKLGNGLAVEQNGDDASVTLGGTKIETNGNQRHVKIGDLDVTTTQSKIGGSVPPPPRTRFAR